MESDRLLIGVYEETVQERAEEILNRKLTKKEMEEVEDRLLGDFRMFEMADDAINETIAYNALVRRNRKAATKPVFYRVYWKNANALQKEYKEVFAALTEEDARGYVDNDKFIDEFVHYKITRFDNGAETEIAIIRNEHFHQSPEMPISRPK
jgi:hypothetical protein